MYQVGTRFIFAIRYDTIRQGGLTRISADVSMPRLAGFSLIT